MATVLSMKDYRTTGTVSPLGRRHLSLISGLACFVGGIGGLVVIVLFLFPFVLMFGCLLKYIGI